jgi:hypothetical protein
MIGMERRADGGQCWSDLLQALKEAPPLFALAATRGFFGAIAS